MNTKYLFLDIDGTLVGFDGVMPSSASEALKKAHEYGYKLDLHSADNSRRFTRGY